MKLKNKIIENRVGLLVTIGMLLIVTILVGISYAYFGGIEIRNNNTVSGNIKTQYYTFATSGNKTISIALEQDKLNIADGSNDYTSFMSNTGGNITIFLAAINGKKVYCTYDLVYVPSTAYVPSTEAKNAGLKEFTLSGTTAAGYKFDDVDISGSNTVTLMKNVLISTNGQYGHNWNFTVKYYNLNVIQNNVIGKTFGGNIKVANVDCSFNEFSGDYVLLKSTGASSVADAKSQISNKGTPNFTTTATTNEGMYAAEDDLGTSYYFRGAVDNNWVKYGKYTKDMYNCNNGTISATDTGNSCTKIASSGDDIYWRIIRINGDGSIRMIYSGTTAPTESTKAVMRGESSIGAIRFNSTFDSAEYVGYMYEIGKQHGTSQSSDIKTYLEDWYANYTDLNKEGTKITDQIYCNDRTASTSSSGTAEEISSWSSKGTNYYYGASLRLYGNSSNSSPSLKCTNANDKFTTTTAKGNGKLSYSVGLITADEVNMAGADNSWHPNDSYYLYIGESYWVGSPYRFRDGDSKEFSVDSGGIPHDADLGLDCLVRGVVSLSSKAKLSGTGTYNDVYTVS